MKLSKIYRKAAKKIRSKNTKQNLKVEFCCEAISVAQNLPFSKNVTLAHDIFHMYYKPSDQPWSLAYFSDTELNENLVRQIALDLLAEIMESKGI